MSKVGATGQGIDFINEKNWQRVSTRDRVIIARGEDPDSQLISGGETVFDQTKPMFLGNVRFSGPISRYDDSSDSFGPKF